MSRILHPLHRFVVVGVLAAAVVTTAPAMASATSASPRPATESTQQNPTLFLSAGRIKPGTPIGVRGNCMEARGENVTRAVLSVQVSAFTPQKKTTTVTATQGTAVRSDGYFEDTIEVPRAAIGGPGSVSVTCYFDTGRVTWTTLAIKVFGAGSL